jgi:hypothetical protein
MNDFMGRFDWIVYPSTDMHKLYRSLNAFIEHLPKSVPIALELDPTIPPNMECDDLLLFRSSFILLNNASSRTKSGAIYVLINVKNGEHASVIFECEDTGPPVVDQKIKLDAAMNSPLFGMCAMV